jgi:catechol 2,3-dioxygenase-like lactoylglutathione lyase family enzyme
MALYNFKRRANTDRMFTSGIATIYISDMDRSVQFYTETLGLRLAQRFGNHWASVEAGNLSIGLHPASDKNPAGRNGSTTVGFEVEDNIEQTVRTLEQKGVKFRGPVAQDMAGKFAWFEDPDGNGMYIYQVQKWGSQPKGKEPVSSVA